MSTSKRAMERFAPHVAGSWHVSGVETGTRGHHSCRPRPLPDGEGTEASSRLLPCSFLLLWSYLPWLYCTHLSRERRQLSPGSAAPGEFRLEVGHYLYLAVLLLCRQRELSPPLPSPLPPTPSPPMSLPQGSSPLHEHDARTLSSSTSAPPSNPPLVIVSERGRHSDAARRIVRAQAARASAAQSRETRARNRGDRHQRDGTQSHTHSNPEAPAMNQPTAAPRPISRPQSSEPSHQTSGHSRQYRQDVSPNDRRPNDQGLEQSTLKPLVNWITNVLRLSASSFGAAAAILVSTGNPQLSNASDVLFNAGGILADSGEAMEAVQVNGGLFNRRLPIALPRGFINLRAQIHISDAFLVLLSRTACFDFGSPGVESRLHELLYDTVMTSATATIPNVADTGHPLESHLRIACTCLTIFQGQRADGQSFAYDQKYNTGFEAAWAEVTVLDQNALKEPKTAEAALWCVLIISVTCGGPISFFREILSSLLRDLQLQYWDEVRRVLLDFIYPGSFLDEPCKQFFELLQSGEINSTGHD